MPQPAKDASPDEAATGLWVQVSWAAPVPVPEVMLRVTAAVLVETRLPRASTTATSGWTPRAWSAWPLPGWVSNLRAAAGPALTSKAALVPKVPSSTSMA